MYLPLLSYLHYIFQWFKSLLNDIKFLMYYKFRFDGVIRIVKRHE